ncbi:MAG: PilZ domain-containing protein [Desulforhopalus sp.]
MTEDTRALNDIPDGKPVRIFLPIVAEEEMVRAYGVYRKTQPPRFDLLFKPGDLPVNDLDDKKPCIVTIDLGGPALSLEAMVRSIAHPQKLEMVARKSTKHPQMRNYFRVDTDTKLVTKSFPRNSAKIAGKPWSYEGITVDISGSGVKALFDEQPPGEFPVQLEITIPNATPSTVKALAHQVRSRKLADGRFEVAFQYDEITSTDRDRIIGSCFEIQRRMLRLKVHVKNDM